MPLVRIDMIKGKNPEYKKKVINEPPLENWGMGGKQKG